VTGAERMRAFLTGVLLVVGAARAAAQVGTAPPSLLMAPTEADLAFVDVNVLTMESSRARERQVVLVRGSRIVGLGPVGAIAVPAGATVIDGRGRYLVPGLTDAHVHLAGDGTRGGATRADFGDAPLYLAHGVTTVVNLGGGPAQLAWKRALEAGTLVGPTIYTSGRFLNEPVVNTPDEVEREIRAQVEAGYDLIKFHEIYSDETGFLTTTGLSLEAYRRMNEVAGELGVPLVGHAPANLGIDVLLDARQALAHVGTLTSVYFLPLTAHRAWLALTLVAFVILLLVIAGSAVALLLRHRHRSRQAPPAVRRTRRLTELAALSAGAAVVCAALALPGGPLFEWDSVRVAFVVLVLFMGAGAWMLTRAVLRLNEEPGVSRATVAVGALSSMASIAFVIASAVFWVPVVWRSSDAGITRVAERLAAERVPVQTTLVVYVAGSGRRSMRLRDDVALQYMRPDILARWRAVPPMDPPGGGYVRFTQALAGALNRAGVPLMAGTDAMGYPFVVPGASLHHELRLLVASGLTPYEALRAATLAPAAFLGKTTEFGGIATAKRADLLLVDGNPLEDLSRLRRPEGVVVRGRWFTRADLDRMLTTMASNP
jgi:imidazolonepropionase-like amidohydrolase